MEESANWPSNLAVEEKDQGTLWFALSVWGCMITITAVFLGGRHLSPAASIPECCADKQLRFVLLPNEIACKKKSLRSDHVALALSAKFKRLMHSLKTKQSRKKLAFFAISKNRVVAADVKKEKKKKAWNQRHACVFKVMFVWAMVNKEFLKGRSYMWLGFAVPFIVWTFAAPVKYVISGLHYIYPRTHTHAHTVKFCCYHSA